jgi:hypothetical protein
LVHLFARATGRKRDDYQKRDKKAGEAARALGLKGPLLNDPLFPLLHVNAMQACLQEASVLAKRTQLRYCAVFNTHSR